MEWDSRFDFEEWLGDLLYRELGDSVDEVWGESNNTTGRCELFIRTKNDEEVTLTIKMQDAELEDK